MVNERRQAHRREAIEVEVTGGKVFTAAPLPWMARNDFGDEVVRQATKSLNEYVKIYTDPELNIPQLEAKLDERLTDPNVILLMIYPGNDVKDFIPLVWSEIVELIFAGLDVNGLERLKRTIDPNFVPPTTNGGTPTSEAGETIGARLGSMLVSSLPGSPGDKSSDSPTEKLSESSENSKNEPGTSGDGI